LFNNGLIFLISNMSNLSLRAKDLFFSLKQHDNNQAKKTLTLMQGDMQRVMNLFKERGIKFKPWVRH